MKTMRLILVITGILLTASFSYGARVNDDGSPNCLGACPNYEYRDMGDYGSSPLGTDGISGAYFQVSAAIKTGGFLKDFDKVLSVTAAHSSGRTYQLAPAACRNWGSPNLWPWYIYLRPQDWMFSGTWSYTLVYKGSDKKEHIQICDSVVDNLGNKHSLVAGPDGAFPPPIFYIQIINTVDGDLQVSWSGIGDNFQYVDYRMEIFDEDVFCLILTYRMALRCSDELRCVGTYDSALNRVSFIVDRAYHGRLVRLSNNIVTPYQGTLRALKQIRLPE